VPAADAVPSTADRLAHLYRRGGFGATADQITSAAASGYDAAVSALVEGLSAADTGADAITAPTLSQPPPPLQRRSMSTADRHALSAQIHHEFADLALWWVSRMLTTTNPLKEKLTFLLHGHFPTAISKVRFPIYMYGQNQIFRTQGGGDFATLTQAVAADPAMLIWLDANSNKASNPNENFARELMERFSMGIGTYAQADVRAGAYCFTGWRVDPRTGTFSVNAAQHSPTSQTFLGTSGVSTGQEVIDIVTHSQASSRFVPSRFWSYLAYPVTANDPVVAHLAPAYAANRNVGQLLSAIFRHPEFSSSKARTGLIKQPVEYLIGTLRALGVTPTALAARSKELLAVLTGLGQVPFDPPSVGGWPQNDYWLSSSAALARWTFAHGLSQVADISTVADASRVERVDAAASLLAVSRWSTTTAKALQRASGDPRMVVTLALVSPEYVSN
jgi:uncharacterized protein (DUF1800 family)